MKEIKVMGHQAVQPSGDVNPDSLWGDKTDKSGLDLLFT